MLEKAFCPRQQQEPHRPPKMGRKTQSAKTAHQGARTHRKHSHNSLKTESPGPLLPPNSFHSRRGAANTNGCARQHLLLHTPPAIHTLTRKLSSVDDSRHTAVDAQPITMPAAGAACCKVTGPIHNRHHAAASQPLCTWQHTHAQGSPPPPQAPTQKGHSPALHISVKAHRRTLPAQAPSLQHHRCHRDLHTETHAASSRHRTPHQGAANTPVEKTGLLPTSGQGNHHTTPHGRRDTRLPLNTRGARSKQADGFPVARSDRKKAIARLLQLCVPEAGDLHVLGGLGAQVGVRWLDRLEHTGNLASGGVNLGHAEHSRACSGVCVRGGSSDVSSAHLARGKRRSVVCTRDNILHRHCELLHLLHLSNRHPASSPAESPNGKRSRRKTHTTRLTLE